VGGEGERVEGERKGCGGGGEGKGRGDEWGGGEKE